MPKATPPKRAYALRFNPTEEFGDESKDPFFVIITGRALNSIVPELKKAADKHLRELMEEGFYDSDSIETQDKVQEFHFTDSATGGMFPIWRRPLVFNKNGTLSARSKSWHGDSYEVTVIPTVKVMK